MKRNIARTRLVIFSVVTICLLSSAYADDLGNCSLANVAGDWAYTYTGTLFAPTAALPVASVGSFTQDGRGNMAGTQNRSVAGTSAVETVTGTITVKTDCTGTLDANVYESGQFVRSAVIPLIYDNNRKHFRAIFRSLTLPNGANVPVTITIDGMRVSSGQ